MAKFLSEHLGASIIRTDDFANWENPFDWHEELVASIFEPIKKGHTGVSYQPTSWFEYHHPEFVSNQLVTPVMILEGVSSSRKEFDDYISFRIFVDTPKNVFLERGISRDQHNNNVEVVTKQWEDWFKAETLFFKDDDPRQKADIILSGTIAFEEQITF